MIFIAYRQGWEEGYRELREWAARGNADHIAHLEAQITGLRAELEAEKRATEPTRDLGTPGRQLVEVNGRYAYAWAGDTPLQVHDKVILPPNHIYRQETTATVTALGSTYQGRHSWIVRRAD